LKVVPPFWKVNAIPKRCWSCANVQSKTETSIESLSLAGSLGAGASVCAKQALSVGSSTRAPAECDRQIEAVLKELAGPEPPADGAESDRPRHVLKPSGQKCAADRTVAPVAGWRICGGRDATALPGIADYLLMQLIQRDRGGISARGQREALHVVVGLASGSKQERLSGKGSVKRSATRAGDCSCHRRAQFGSSRSTRLLGGFYRDWPPVKVPGGRCQGAGPQIGPTLLPRSSKYGLEYAERGLRAYEQKYAESQRRLLAKLAAKQGFRLCPPKLDPTSQHRYGK